MGASSSGRIDGDAVDHVPDARHPPGKHASKTLCGEARHAAIQGDDAELHLNGDLAFRGRQSGAHKFRLTFFALRDGELLERRLLVIGLAQMVQDAVIAHGESGFHP